MPPKNKKNKTVDESKETTKETTPKRSTKKSSSIQKVAETKSIIDNSSPITDISTENTTDQDILNHTITFEPPNEFSQFHIHKSIIQRLRPYDSPSSLPPGMIFVGNHMCGKRTLIRSFIHHLIQKPIVTKVHHDTCNDSTVEFIHSPYHIEFHLEEYGLTDRYIVGEYIKKILDCQTIDGRIRIYVFYGLDTYTYETQDMFVHLMEKYVASARFIFTVSSMQKIHRRVNAISTTIRIPFPSNMELRSYLASHGLSMMDIDSHLRNIINDGHLGRLRHFSKESTANQPVIMNMDQSLSNVSSAQDILWNQIKPFIDREDINSVVEMRPYLYDAITLTMSMYDFIIRICRYVIQQCPLKHIDRMSECVQEFTNLEAKMHQVKHDIVCVEYAVLLAKRYLHGYFRQ
jgi:hypothetical protein